MSIIDSVKNTAFSTAVKTVMDYLEKDPEKNIPKAMSMMDKVLPDGWYEGQRAAFRKAIAEKGNWYQLIMKAYQLDAGVRKTFFQNFIVNSALKGSAIQNEIRERENCNVPWAVLLDPTSACNLHCTGCWAAEYGHKLSLDLETIDSIIRQGKEMGTYMYIYTGGEPMVRKAVCREWQETGCSIKRRLFSCLTCRIRNWSRTLNTFRISRNWYGILQG